MTATIVVFADGPSQVPVLAEVCRNLAADEALRVVPMGLAVGPPTGAGRAGDGLWARFLTHVVRPLVLGPILRRRCGGYRDRLVAEDARLVILAEDNVGGRSRLMAAAADGCGVPVLIVPFTIPNPRELLNVLSARLAHRVRWPWQRAFLARHPDWGRTDPESGATLLRLPLLQAWQMARAGLAPARPWIANDGVAARIAVDGDAARDAHLACGVAAEKLVTTGGALDDRLHAAAADGVAARERLYADLGLDPGRPLLLVAFPPNQIDQGAAPRAAYDSFGTLVRETLAALDVARDTFNVVVRPHPRLDPAWLEGLGDARLAVTDRDTADLVPLCDLYVATASATIRWALALGKPVIDYDVYRYDLGDYAAAVGVRTARDAPGLKALLEVAAGDLDGAFGGREARDDDARHWGVIDGQAGTRLRALVREMAGVGGA